MKRLTTNSTNQRNSYFPKSFSIYYCLVSLVTFTVYMSSVPNQNVNWRRGTVYSTLLILSTQLQISNQGTLNNCLEMNELVLCLLVYQFFNFKVTGSTADCPFSQFVFLCSASRSTLHSHSLLMNTYVFSAVQLQCSLFSVGFLTSPASRSLTSFLAFQSNGYTTLSQQVSSCVQA